MKTNLRSVLDFPAKLPYQHRLQGSLRNQPTRQGLVAEWRLSGDGNDTNPGTKNNGTVSNLSYVDAVAGYNRQAGDFNGSTSVVTINAITSFSPIFGGGKTVMFNAQLDGTGEGGAGSFFRKLNEAVNGVGISFLSNPSLTSISMVVRRTNGVGAATFTWGTVPTFATMRHVTLYFNTDEYATTGTPELWIDNAPIAAPTFSGVARATYDGANEYANLYLGNASDNTRTLDGRMHEFKIFNRRLTDAERTEYYNEFLHLSH